MQEWVQRLTGSGRRATERSQVHRGLVATLSCVGAMVLWTLQSLSGTAIYETTLQTRVVDVPADSALRSTPPNSVVARLSGRRSDLLLVHFRQPALVLDGAAATIDTRAALAVPGELVVESVLPESIELDKDVKARRRVPVKSRVRFVPDAAFERFDPVEVRPDSVTIEGAGEVLRQLDGWPTRAIQLDGFRDSASVLVELADTLAGLVELELPSVEVIARAQRFTEGVRVLEVQVSGLPTTHQAVLLDPPEVEVVFRVPLDQYEMFRNSDLTAIIPYAVIRADTSGFVIPELSWPEELHVRHVSALPSRLRYFINIGS